ncbi:hypothetical protein CRYUN_Cryun05aG0146000 [Craigia yunnanensis]
MLEASEVVCALELAQQMGFLNIENEGDALGNIRKLQGVEKDLSPIGTLADEAETKSRSFPATSCTQGEGQYGRSLFDKVWVENARGDDMSRRIS